MKHTIERNGSFTRVTSTNDIELELHANNEVYITDETGTSIMVDLKTLESMLRVAKKRRW